MKKILCLILAVLMLSITACGSADYDALYEKYTALQEDFEAVEDENNTLKETITSLEDETKTLKETISTLESDIDSLQSQVSDDTVNTEPQIPESDKVLKYELLEFSIFPAISSIGGCIANYIITFKNAGNVDIYINSIDVDFEDQEGKLVGTDSTPSCSHLILKPGETGYIFNNVSFDTDITNTILKCSTFIDYYEATVQDIRPEVTEFSYSVNLAKSLDVLARINNTTNKKIEDGVRWSVVFFDKNGSALFGDEAGMYDDLEIGQKKAVKSYISIADERVLELIDSYKVYAFEHFYQFNW